MTKLQFNRSYQHRNQQKKVIDMRETSNVSSSEYIKSIDIQTNKKKQLPKTVQMSKQTDSSESVISDEIYNAIILIILTLIIILLFCYFSDIQSFDKKIYIFSIVLRFFFIAAVIAMFQQSTYRHYSKKFLIVYIPAFIIMIGSLFLLFCQSLYIFFYIISCGVFKIC